MSTISSSPYRFRLLIPYLNSFDCQAQYSHAIALHCKVRFVECPVLVANMYTVSKMVKLKENNATNVIVWVSVYPPDTAGAPTLVACVSRFSVLSWIVNECDCENVFCFSHYYLAMDTEVWYSTRTAT